MLGTTMDNSPKIAVAITEFYHSSHQLSMSRASQSLGHYTRILLNVSSLTLNEIVNREMGYYLVVLLSDVCKHFEQVSINLQSKLM